MHLHARNEDGSPTQSPEVYAQIIDKIKERCDIIIQISTGGAIGMSKEERIAPVRLKPEMATLTVGSCNFGGEVFLNPLDEIEFFAHEMKKNGVFPEIEIFDLGMIANAESLMKKDLIPRQVHFNFVMGVPGAIPATPRNLLLLSESIPSGCTWSVAGIGKAELPMAVMAIIMGGNVRLGFEDNIYYSRGVLAESNAHLIKRIVNLAKELGREVATPDEARKIIGLR